MKKMALFDIDGTLTRPDGSISQAVVDKLKELSRDGVKVVLASGRPTLGMLSVAETFDLHRYDSYIISYNGCAIYQVNSGEYLAQHFMHRDVVADLALAVEDHPQIGPIYYSNEQIVTTRRNEFVEFEAKLNQRELHVWEGIPPLTPKVIWAAAPEILDRIELEIQDLFGARCTIARSLPCFLEFTPLGVDKGYALEELCSLLKHPVHATVAFGDGNNDKSMLEKAGVGVAMSNGRAELKAIADFIAPPNDQDGVIVAIEQFLC